jgi:hypothetical protein
LKSSRKLTALLSCLVLTLIVFLGYIYVTAIEVVRLRPRMLYVEKCDADTVSQELSLTFESVNGNGTLDKAGKMHDGVMGSLFDDHRLFFKIPQKFRNFAIPKLTTGANGMGQALKFNGKNWVHAGNSQCYTGDVFTISLWAWKAKSAPIAKGDWLVPTLAAKSDWPGSGWWLCTEPNTNNIDMAVSFGIARKHIHSGFLLEPETWHHLSVTMDNVKHEIQFYVDGQLFGEVHKDVPVWITNYDQNLFIGDYDGTARWPWFGKIDNVHFHSTKLSAEEIKEIYTQEGGKG